jgi:hypothetical protein
VKETTHVDPLTNKTLAVTKSRFCTTETLPAEIVDKVARGINGDEDVQVLPGTVTIIVRSCRPNLAHVQYQKAREDELTNESPMRVIREAWDSSLSDSERALPKAELDAKFEMHKANALAQAMEECPYPETSIVTQIIEGVDLPGLEAMLQSVRNSGLKGSNKLVDLLTAKTTVPPEEW